MPFRKRFDYRAKSAAGEEPPREPGRRKPPSIKAMKTALAAAWMKAARASVALEIQAPPH